MVKARRALLVLLFVLLFGTFVFVLGTEIPEVAPSAGVATSTTPSVISNEPANLPPVYKSAVTTQFWVGESADESNGFIANDQSYWDASWQEHYGGVDGPMCREGYHPCAFTPLENPFYFALPYGEYAEDSDKLKRSVLSVPWFLVNGTELLLKNRWIEVMYGGKTCYGQWQDVGPFLTDDANYVFGNASASNTFGEKAGLDISPALWDCLALEDNKVTKWRFVDVSQVPGGPWKEIITTSGIDWE